MTADRKTYIGSSDARDLLYGNWAEVWEKKTCRRADEDLSDKFEVQAGVFMEPFLVGWLGRRMKPQGYRVHPSSDVFRGDPGYIGATPDATVHDSDHWYPAECKFGSRGFSQVEQVIEWYMPQIQHHLLATGCDRCLVSISMNRDEPQNRWVSASDEWHDHMCRVYAEFWALVQSDTRPAPTYARDMTPQPLSIDAVPINGKVAKDMSTDNSFLELAHQYAQLKPVAEAFERAKNELKAKVGPNVREAYVPGLIKLKRDAKGAIRFTVEAQQAAE